MYIHDSVKTGPFIQDKKLNLLKQRSNYFRAVCKFN